MNFRIIFTPEAEETYDALSAQLRHRWGNSYVINFENKISKSLDLIRSSPYAYPIIDEVTQVRRCLLHKNCSMLYKVNEEAVVVICFWDNRQDPIIIT